MCDQENAGKQNANRVLTSYRLAALWLTPDSTTPEMAVWHAIDLPFFVGNRTLAAWLGAYQDAVYDFKVSGVWRWGWSAAVAFSSPVPSNQWPEEKPSVFPILGVCLESTEAFSVIHNAIVRLRFAFICQVKASWPKQLKRCNRHHWQAVFSSKASI